MKPRNGSRRKIGGALIGLVVLAVTVLSGIGGALPANAQNSPAAGPSARGDDVHYLGGKPSDPTGCKQIEALPGAGMPLAASVNLASQIPPIGNQGNQSSCVSWACSYYYKSWSEKKMNPTNNLNNSAYQFSPAFVYNQVNGGVDDGSSFSDNFRCMQNKGDLSLKDFPYDEFNWTRQPTAAQSNKAKQYQISDDWGYFWVRPFGSVPYNPPNDLTQVKAWLAGGKMLTMMMPIYFDLPGSYGNPAAKYYDYNGSAGYVGAHGVAIVGYNDNINPSGPNADHRGGFLMANSWGPGWNGANNGFIYLSYDFVKRYMYEAWYMNDVPTAADTWYLAEGSTAWGFGCSIGIMNPNSTDVRVKITYQTDTGAVDGGTYIVNAMSSGYAYPIDTLGERDFSTKVECLDKKPIAVDRTMFWSPQYPPDADTFECHASVGVNAPAKQWYLPEGSSNWGFECWLLIQNPGGSSANCAVTYMIEGEGPRTVNHTVPPRSRRTYNMADDIGNQDASIEVSANVPVIPERAMYKDQRREGHDSIGTTAPATDYYLAEGTTAWGFTTYILIQNPQSSVNTVNVTYMTPQGPVNQAAFTMPPGSRTTIRVNDMPGMSSTDCSTRVHGSKPLIAERSMYWYGGIDEAQICHDSVGMAQPHTTFYLPSGGSGMEYGSETWTLVQNLNTSSVKVRITYVSTSGEDNVAFEATIPAQSRQTFNMADRISDANYGTIVESLSAGKKIMVERAMYWDGRGAGTDTIGGYSD